MHLQASPFPPAADVVDNSKSEEVGGKEDPTHQGNPCVRINNVGATDWSSSGGEGGRFSATSVPDPGIHSVCRQGDFTAVRGGKD